MAKKTKKKIKKPSIISKVKSFLSDEKTKIILGGIFVISTFLLTLSFISYLFTWQADQSKLELDFFTYILNPDITAENWVGKIGAKISYLFIHNWFGLASFPIIFIMGLFSLYLFNYKPISLKKAFKYSLLLTIWLSIVLGYAFGKKYFSLGGSHGYYISNWLNSIIGKTGTLLVLLTTVFIFAIFTFNNSISWLKGLFTRKKEIIDNKFDDIDSTDKVIPFEEELPEEDEENKINLPIVEINDSTKDEEVESSIELEVNVIENTNDKTDNEELELTVDNNETLEEDEAVSNISTEPVGDYDPTLDLSNYKLPPVEILVDHRLNDSIVTDEELKANSDKIVKTLNDYKITIDKISATIGPTITLYEIIPAAGVRIAKIKNLEDDIALSLAALGIRIIAPIPGRGTIGIEVPNSKPEIVSMKSIIISKKFQESKMDLPLVLGRTISNEIFMLDLAKAPHMLVAGATGQGKSVGINAIITSLLYKMHPSQLKFVLIDPKKVELSVYASIERHFLAKLPDEEEAIITDVTKVVLTLNSLAKEMDNRYDLLKGVARNIKEYNAKFVKRKLNPEKGHRFLPYIVVIIDEFADLIMTAGKEVEMPIARIAQLARAVGIHLVVATQRPSTNVITGIIKANFPTRVSFKVTSMVDSRTILDSPGANNLIGRGDMLISNGSDMTRVQCAFIDTPEVEEISEYIGSQQGYPTALLLPEADAYPGEDSQGEAPDLQKRDKLFNEAAKVLVQSQQGSTSGIQRRLSIGYARAGRIMDQLEAAGIVGPFNGSKARDVLYQDEYSLEQFLNTLVDPESTIGRQ